MMDPEQRVLIDAVNVICEYVFRNLPADWQIVLTMESEDAGISLLKPDGGEVEIAGGEYGISTLKEMCDAAREIDTELQGETDENPNHP